MDLQNRSVPPEMMPHVFSCVGMIVVSWTFVENNLDAWSAIAYHDHGGSSVEAELPRPLSRKIRFLKKCFRRLDSLSAFTDEVVDYLEKVGSLSAIRHYVAHGVLSHFDPTDASFWFMKLDMDGQNQQHILGELRILGTDLTKAGEDLTEMAKAGHAITRRLLDAMELRRPSDSSHTNSN